MNKIKYWWLKLLRGECPDCHELLVDVPGWGRADCLKCGRHFKYW
jgi:hypothetical protein